MVSRIRAGEPVSWILERREEAEEGEGQEWIWRGWLKLRAVRMVVEERVEVWGRMA